MTIRILCIYTLIIFSEISLFAQNCINLNIQHRADIASTCPFMVMTMIHDQQNRPYLYVANKEAGLKIYDISTITTPSLVAAVPTTLFDTLDVMNLSQAGNYIYLAIGNHFNSNQESGMAIIDVSNPLSPTVTDYWKLTSSTGGSGIVKTEGNYAYLGAMGNGLIILDISNKSNIVYLSQFKPDINYPTASPNPALYNARGMEIKNDIVYLCYDAGGLRIINTSVKTAPLETGRFSNPVMNGLPRAYNNLILDDSLVYITVDYCGLEVLNVSDTSNITLTGWWNPYNCPGNNWFSSPVHANEIQYEKTCKRLFISTGKSDLYVLDVSNPTLPDSCNFYGGVSNNIGSWGVGLYLDQIYLSYVCALIPFASNWTGVKILNYNNTCLAGVNEQLYNTNLFSIVKNNESNIELLFTKELMNQNITIRVFDYLGRDINSIYRVLSERNIAFDLADLQSGVYFILVESNSYFQTEKFIKK